MNQQDTINKVESSLIATQQACLEDNNLVFQRLVAKSNAYLKKGQYHYAAALAEIAAYHGTWKHNGLFVSYELEKILWAIAKQTIKVESTSRVNTTPKIDRVLHVTSMVSGLAGLQNLLRRWIELDGNRSHSVAVSQPSWCPAPEKLNNLVTASGGSIEFVGDTYREIIARAQRIRDLATEADLVVLHLQTEDLAPIIGLSQKTGCPPVVLVNHADHAFWLGATATDLIVNLRTSGLLLCQERRGIDPDRLVLLPTPLEPITRTLSSEEAKQRLRLPTDSILLLSVARAPKYKTKSGVSYPLSHVGVLQKYQNCFLFVVGPEHDADWEYASQKVNGRIKAFGERADTALFFQAADIYVDAFPMVSITSLLEAGSFGLPVVSRCQYSEKSAIWGADAPGLDRYLIRCQNLDDYAEQLGRLVENKELRTTIGKSIQEQIKQIHVGENWLKSLDAFYSKVEAIAEKSQILFPQDRRNLSEPDLLMPTLLSNGQKVEEMFYQYRKALPLDWFHLKLRIKLLWHRPTMLVPNFLRSLIKKLKLKTPNKKILLKF